MQIIGSHCAQQCTRLGLQFFFESPTATAAVPQKVNLKQMAPMRRKCIHQNDGFQFRFWCQNRPILSTVFYPNNTPPQENLISRLRVLLSIQPIKPGDALSLDKMIASKIHHITGFPYNPNTDILTLPVDLHGLDYPSVARINAGIATEGLWRDLNHHVPAYRKMARLTLADWTCTINHCVCPLDGKGLLRDFTGQYRKIPAAWIIVHKS